jgi:hypothetical protein
MGFIIGVTISGRLVHSPLQQSSTPLFGVGNCNRKVVGENPDGLGARKEGMADALTYQEGCET